MEYPAPLDETQFRAEIKAALNPQQSIDLSVLQWTENHAQKRLEIMQKVFDDDAFWKSSPILDRRMLQRLMVKLALRSGALPGDLQVSVTYIGSAPKRIGGFADIYKGEMDGRAVAVKHLHSWVVLRPSERDKLTWNLSREALTLRNLKHKNILEFLGIHIHNFYGPGIVLPWVERSSVMDYLDDCEPSPSVEQRIQWLHAIAKGAHYLHAEAGIAHGDIKGRNVLITTDGQIKISDFGLSVYVEGSSFGSERGGHMIWMAPENLWSQAMKGSPPLRPTFASDVYAFGITSMEILVGANPWTYSKTGNNCMDPAWPLQVSDGDRPDIPNFIPQYLASALRTWWHNRPEKRPTMEKIVAFFNNPKIQTNSPPTSYSYSADNSPGEYYEPPTAFISSLCEYFPKDENHLRSPEPVLFNPRPSCPLHIVIDEKAFITGLYKCCGSDASRAARFSYSAFKVILERKRRVSSRTLFLSRKDAPSQSSHPLRSIGYQYTSSPHTDPHESIQFCIDKIEKILTPQVGTPQLGVLVLFSGGGAHGWLSDVRFCEYILAAHARGWQIEMVVWGNMTPDPPLFNNISDSDRFSIVHLENFYPYLIQNKK